MTVNPSDVPATGLSARAPARVEEPPGPTVGPGTSSWTGGRVASLVIGAVLGLLALGLLGAGGVATWAYLAKRDAGYVTTDVHKFSTAGWALVTEPTELGSAGVGGWLYPPTLLGEVRIRVTPSSPGSELFVGIGRSSDVDRYLAGVKRTVISDFWGNDAGPTGGGELRSAPGTRRFWAASATGTGTQTVVWKPSDGSWSVVVMNADGSPGVDIGADLGASIPALPWVALGVLVGGVIFMVGGLLLIVGAFRRRTD